jgi:ABC-type antimicrobial peptide transport system permease subunit
MTIPWESPYFWLAGLAVVLFTGILAGSYPAFYLSSFKPVKVLKGIIKTGSALVTPRKVLVIVQFVLAVFLINFTILFRKQVKYGEGRDIGFVKENLVFHQLTADLRKNYDLVKNELINAGIATSVCMSNTPVTRGGTGLSGLQWKGTTGKNNISFELLETSGDYVVTNGLTLAAGRDIDIARFSTDTASCMINEASAKVLGFKNPVGEVIVDDGFNWKIVGVVKDFFMGSPGEAVAPALIRGSRRGNFINVRLKSNASIQTFKNLEGILKKYNPNFLTEYQFADADYANKFRQAHNASMLINSFAIIAIFISCMGLFGLATYMAENRTREIGIRKVLGASVSGITSLLTREFIKLVVIAVVIATPLAWLIMHSFLQQFAYRTTISWWIFVVTGISALLIAMFTVSYQSIKAAIANPVKSLRTE